MLNASIVIYKHSLSEIAPLVNTLRKSDLVSVVYLIDNSPVENPDFYELDVEYIFNGKNLGYGAANNIAIRKSILQSIPYHLVVNPDIDFGPDILLKIVDFMNNNSNIGLLMPKIIYPSGKIQYLCKLIPTPFDLIFRRFVPKDWTKKRTERFELHMSGYNRIIDVPYLSGCFMFLRTTALEEVGIFDERFFMYPEDIDLSRRMHSKFRTVYFPEVEAVHHHEKASYATNKMLFVHVKNLIIYFNKWGWIVDSERKNVNRKILNQL